MNNCKNLKIKLNHTLYCKQLNKEIQLKNCTNCKFKEFKSNNYKNNSKIKSKTAKLSNLEKNRFSILTDDLEHCIICGKSPINKHEIFFGSKNRQNSIKYGLVIPLCTAEHHNQVDCKGIHFNKELRLEWQKKGQKKFMEYYRKSEEEFIEIFHRNYL